MSRISKSNLERGKREILRAMNQASALQESVEKLQAIRCEVCETSSADDALVTTLNAALWSIEAAAGRAFDALNEAELES